MLGRIRNLKTNNILTYYQNISLSTDSILYNYNEIIDYFKYCDTKIKTSKIYKVNKEDSTIEIVNGFKLYDKIMMCNRIENLNKSGPTFMTQLNTLFNESNYKIVFLNNTVDKKKKVELNDDVYKDKILNSEDIDEYEFKIINKNILSNIASEKDKFKYHKYKFKQFWNLEKVDKNDFNLYFRSEYIYVRLLTLLNKKITNNNEYNDYDVNKKIVIIENIIKTIGFDLNKLDIKIPREQYYENIKLLMNIDNIFKKDYDNIRILFGKDKHKLKDNLKGQSISKLLNGFFDDFGLKIINKKTCKKINKINTYSTTYF
jgi:hypothetical protein